ncbi:hypothetical protein DPMN_004647 [Dreissena polymorpha]|uniref:Uncharacterized protein n=1 Tax=Dreissena polymorpha TaxID=45954 RepID=A0A9D4RVS7_DREPO|nr:hypothetical protein DPMN_004647 [Dreissena polymorpha]
MKQAGQRRWRGYRQQLKGCEAQCRGDRQTCAGWQGYPLWCSKERKVPSRTKSTRSSQRMFSSGPRGPSFQDSRVQVVYLHQKLLSDLLFSIETEFGSLEEHPLRETLLTS